MQLKQENNNTIQTFWVAIGSLSSFALAIVSAAILSRYFDKAEYGTYRQILYIYNTLLVIFTAGLPRVFSYFLPRFSVAQGKDIVWKLSMTLFGAGLLFSIFLFLFSGLIADLLRNPELATGLRYFSPIPMLLLPTMGIEGIFATYKKTIYIAIYNTLTRGLMLLFIVLPVILLKGTYLYAIYGWLAVSFIILLLAYYFKGIPFKEVKAEKATLSYRDIFSYSLPLAVASLAVIALRAADQFYISRFFGTEVFAEFSNGFIELPFVLMITGAVSTVLMPLFSKLVHEKSEFITIITMWRSSLLKSAMLIYPMVIFFILNAESVIVLLYSAAYLNSVVYFQIAIVLNFFNIIFFAPLLLALGKTKLYSWIHMLFAVLAWTLGYLIVVIFNSPVAIAVFSVSLAIIKVLVFMKYVSVLVNATFFDLVPVKKITVLTFHSFIVAGILKLLMSQFFPHVTMLVSLAVNCAGFLLLILLTAKIFKLDYLSVLQPIIGKYFKKQINAHS